MTQVVSISFYRFSSRRARLWALMMMVGARLAIRRVPDIGFWKICGSGGGVGFTPRINIDVFAILATWPDEATAHKRTLNTAIFNRYSARACETWTVYLRTDSVRGEWAGKSPFVISNTGKSGPIGVLTRATIKPSILRRFWARVPGESPLFQQITFSLWPDAAAVANFARTGHHAEAIKSVRAEKWFREELYARFTLLSDHGSWADAPYLQQR